MTLSRRKPGTGVTTFYESVKFDISKESGLVAFDGEVVMGLTLQAQIVGELTLGQQGICGNTFVLDCERPNWEHDTPVGERRVQIANSCCLW